MYKFLLNTYGHFMVTCIPVCIDRYTEKSHSAPWILILLFYVFRRRNLWFLLFTLFIFSYDFPNQWKSSFISWRKLEKKDWKKFNEGIESTGKGVYRYEKISNESEKSWRLRKSRPTNGAQDARQILQEHHTLVRSYFDPRVRNRAWKWPTKSPDE